MTFKPLVKHTPTIEIDYDKYGHCVMCHRYLMYEKVIDGAVRLINSPDYSEEEFVINDGSRMRVAICDKCKEELTEDDNDKVMDCVIKGWDMETQYIPHWTEDMRKSHMDKYSKKNIMFQSAGMANDVVEKKLKIIKERKVK